MSEEQLSALLAKLNEDAGLREKLQSAADLDAAVALAKQAGFDVSKADWLKHQANQTLELSDEELDRVAGGNATGGWVCSPEALEAVRRESNYVSDGCVPLGM